MHKAHAEQLRSAELPAGARGSPEAGPGWFPVALVPAAPSASLTRPLPRSKTCPGAGLAAPGGRESGSPAAGRERARPHPQPSGGAARRWRRRLEGMFVMGGWFCSYFWARIGQVIFYRTYINTEVSQNKNVKPRDSTTFSEKEILFWSFFLNHVLTWLREEEHTWRNNICTWSRRAGMLSH